MRSETLTVVQGTLAAEVLWLTVNSPISRTFMSGEEIGANALVVGAQEGLDLLRIHRLGA